MKKTDEQKLDELEEMLDQLYLETAQDQGGYPAAVCHVPGFMIVADVEDDEPSLSIWDDASCLRWLRDIKRYLKDNPDEDLRDAIYETMPKEWHSQRG
jgi:hypothetical protein